MNKKTIIIVSIAVACGLLAVFLVNTYITTKEKGIYKGMEMIPIIAITQDTVAGQKITTQIISKRSVPKKYLPTNAVLAKDYELLLGQQLVYPMKRGDTVMWTSLSSEVERLLNSGLANTVTKGERALSIAVDEVSGVSGLIKPNDHIDILCTVRSEIDEEEATITLLQNITVLATGLAMAGDDNKKGGYRTLTLLVTLEEAELIVFAQKKGRLITILRNEEDIETKKDIPKVTFSDILKDEYRKHIQERRNSIEVIKKGKTEKRDSK